MRQEAVSAHEHGPVVRLVNTLLETAVKMSASDIHLDPSEDKMHIRFRIDGILYAQEGIDRAIMQQVTARLKVLAHIDIAEKRIPQDGKFCMSYGKTIIDFRVATFPALWGQKIVIRILDRGAHTVSLEKLGFGESLLHSFKQQITRAAGFFLVAGPTGSGKTTTLYAALTDINGAEKHIITLENPVEYNLPGITQGQINPDVGFTFEKGMRALLRQDPDIVMVGEMRDKQTARIAIEAALTGHLVFSTVHTNDAPSVVARLMDMGIEPFLINAALTGVLAQRLARKICNGCRTAITPTFQEKQMLESLGFGVEKLYTGIGCDACTGLGYKGRTGIFELLVMNNTLRAMLVNNPSVDHIAAQAKADGMRTLLHDGAAKVASGIISLSELLRVV